MSMTKQMDTYTCLCTHIYVHMYIRDLQYTSIQQYIDTLIEYRIVILCSMNIEIFKCLMVLHEWCMSCVVDITFCVFKVGDKHSILVRKVTDYLYSRLIVY